MADKPKADAANAESAKAQRAADARQAMSDYEAEQAAVAAKTARLRAERLARDAALPPKEPAKKTKPAAGKKAGKKNEPKASLADWLDAQSKDGRH
jgi:hypothetical protein